MMDVNIDSNREAKHNKIYKNLELFKMLHDHVTANNLCCHNNTFTRFVKHQPPSCIDHVYSNCPHKMYNISTVRTPFSNCAMIICYYKMAKKNYTPKFFNIKNRKNLTRNN